MTPSTCCAVASRSIARHPARYSTLARRHHPAFATHFLAPAWWTPARCTPVATRSSFHTSPSRLVSASPPPRDADEKSVAKPKASLLQRAWTIVKTEAIHYWHGTKLLGKEIRLSAKYQMKLLRGKKLTRRERRQLKRTTSDLLRLVPFSVFVIVPFMELLLPVALKLFPNMLPSTFRVESKELEKKRKLLKVRLEMAKFLQETLRESGVRSADKIKESEEFKEFFRKIRNTGEKPSTDDIVRVAKLFEDDLTLDNLSRPQLVSMCRYMNINAFGTDNFLRYTIRSRLDHLEKDDRLIDNEGIEALSLSELSHACQSRGVRTMGVDEADLRKELGQWIELHIHRELSGTLLILGRAFAYTRAGGNGGQETDDSTLESLKDALSSLPDTLLNEAELEVSSESITNKQRLAVLEEQEELIADESEQEMKEEEARKAKKEAEREREELERAEKEKVQADQMLPEQQAQALQEEPAVIDPKDVRMTSEQLNELGEALSILSAKSSVIQERQDLQKLMEENAESADEASEGMSATLVKRIQKMISEIDRQLDAYDSEVGNKMHQIDVRSDGRISVADLQKALAAIKHAPTEDAMKVIVDKLDVDHDGWIPLDHVLSLAQEEGLGIVIDDDSNSGEILAQGKKIRSDGHVQAMFSSRHSHPSPSSSPSSSDGSSSSSSETTKSSKSKEEVKPKKSDIVED